MCCSLSLVVRSLAKTTHAWWVVVLLCFVTAVLNTQLLLTTLIVFLSWLLDCPGPWKRLPVRILCRPGAWFFKFFLFLLNFYFVFGLVGLDHVLKHIWFLQFLLFFLLNLNYRLWSYRVLSSICPYTRVKTLSSGSSNRHNLLLVRHRWLLPLRHWLIFQIEILILNLLRVRNLSIIGNSCWIAAVLSIALDSAPDPTTRSLLRGILGLAISTVLGWLASILLSCCWRGIAGSCWSCLFSVLTAQVVLLLEFWNNSLFYVAEVSMLKSCQLY